MTKYSSSQRSDQRGGRTQARFVGLGNRTGEEVEGGELGEGGDEGWKRRGGELPSEPGAARFSRVHSAHERSQVCEFGEVICT